MPLTSGNEFRPTLSGTYCPGDKRSDRSYIGHRQGLRFVAFCLHLPRDDATFRGSRATKDGRDLPDEGGDT